MLRGILKIERQVPICKRKLLCHESQPNVFIEHAKDKPGTSEELWCSLKSKLLDLRNYFVPLGKPSNKQTRKEKESIPIHQLTREAINNKNKKHRLWMLTKTRNDAEVARLQYIQARNKVKRLLRKAKRTFKQEIAQLSKSNPKAFWCCTRRKLKTKIVVAP